MKKKTIREKLVLNFRNLKSKNETLYDNAFNYLVGQFFESDDAFNIDDLDLLDQLQVIQSMLLSFIKGLYEDRKYLEILMLTDIYEDLKVQVGEHITQQEDLYVFTLSNDFYVSKLQQIIK